VIFTSRGAEAVLAGKPDCDTSRIIDGLWVQSRLRELAQREARHPGEQYDDLLDDDADIAYKLSQSVDVTLW